MFKKIRDMADKVPHFFAKMIVVYCVASATLFSAATYFLAWFRGMELSGTLAVVIGFFGGELLLLAAKTIFKKTDKLDEEESKYTGRDC